MSEHEGQHNAESGALLRHLADLIEQTKDLDYDPSQMDGAWVCGEHGTAECEQGECAGLPWPKPNADAVLGDFMDWADAQFRRVVRPYDNAQAEEMPDEAFRSYSVWEWPIGDLIERRTSPDKPTAATAGAEERRS